MADSPQNWLHENFSHTGSAFGLRIVRKLEEVQSPFQKIEMYESSDWGNVMLIDGAMMVTTRDNFFYHEMMAHAPLYTHRDPKDVVIIGGGDCGTLREVLKHAGVRRAVQCDIDEQVTRMSEKYFPELCESNADPRATVMFDDGIAYMAKARAGSIDVIIVDSTDPVGPAEGLFKPRLLRELPEGAAPGRPAGAAERVAAGADAPDRRHAQGDDGSRLPSPSARCLSRSPATRPATGAARSPARRRAT
jgi:spermidine synthase